MTNTLTIPLVLAELITKEPCSVDDQVRKMNAIDELRALLAAPAVERQESDLDAAARLVEGKTVSVDVSTGDQDAGNRLFCKIVEVMEDGDSFVLLAVDPEPNFESSPPAPVAVARVAALESLCAELYQVLGALDAGADALDKVSAAANGQKIPEVELLPYQCPQISLPAKRQAMRSGDYCEGWNACLDKVKEMNR